MLRSTTSFVLAVFVCLTLSLPAHSASKSSRTQQERRAIRSFNAARKNQLQLRAFLAAMPKGADLHMHFSGAVYAETFLKDAAADLLCVNPVTLSFTKNAGTTRSIPPQPVCARSDVRADSVFKDQHLYDALVDSFSMRSFVPSAGISGHDQFFATFDRFRGIAKSRAGEWLDEIASRAAAQNEQYLEIMNTPSFDNAYRLSTTIPWPTTPVDPAANPTGDATGTTPADLARLRGELLAGGLRDDIAIDSRQFADILESRNRIERCDQPSAAPACSVKVRFIYQVLRAAPPQQVFAQTLLGFELASHDPNVVGINFVEPEDAFYSMSEYHRQMLMLNYLHSVYPKVHISLHAGELAPGMVPPAGLRFHIREAVELGHAERIGHGVDVMYENNPHALLNEMASRHVMVEINLTSNDVILGVNAAHHPLPLYRDAHVPVALSTDDEGVSRIDLTNEYTRAARDFNLTYADLKDMARTSLEHSFLPGHSLWQKPDAFTRLNAACASQSPGSEKPSTRCRAFLESSEKAAQEWELERRYRVFEEAIP